MILQSRACRVVLLKVCVYVGAHFCYKAPVLVNQICTMYMYISKFADSKVVFNLPRHWFRSMYMQRNISLFAKSNSAKRGDY